MKCGAPWRVPLNSILDDTQEETHTHAVLAERQTATFVPSFLTAEWCKKLWDATAWSMKAFGVDPIAGLKDKEGSEQLSKECVSRILGPFLMELGRNHDIMPIMTPEEIIKKADGGFRRTDYTIRDSETGQVYCIVEVKKCLCKARDYGQYLGKGTSQCIKDYITHFSKAGQLQNDIILGLVTDGLRWILIEVSPALVVVSGLLEISDSTALHTLLDHLASRMRKCAR